MSVQLVVFPQNYQGYQYTSGAGFLQYVSDNSQYITVGTGASDIVITAGQSPSDAITASPPNTNWKKYNTTGGTAPTVVAGDLRFTGQSDSTKVSGIYQRIDGLTVGAQYKLYIHLDSTSSTSFLSIGAPGYPNTLGGTNNFTFLNPTVLGTSTPWFFTAQNTSEILSLNYSATDAATLDIAWIKIKNAQPTENSSPRDGQVIVDLYEEEEIPLTLSVDDFKNVAEKVQSYSKDFNLPATKRNNKIFDNIFDITRKDTGLVFNPYTQTQAILKENGFTIFQGFLRLIEIKTQKGETSYNVNLYSEAIALADMLKARTFSQLDFTELSHNYNRDTIQDSRSNSTGLPLINTLPTTSFAYDSSLASPTDHTIVVKYPFVDWTGKVNFEATNGFSYSQVANGATAGMPSINQSEDAFRPWINIKYIINKIFQAADFTWTSTFFDTTDFGKLFMDFNWGNDASPNDYTVNGSAINVTEGGQTSTTSWEVVQFDECSNTNWIAETGYDISTGKFTAPSDNTKYRLRTTIRLQWTSAVLDRAYFQWKTSTGLTYPLPQAQGTTGTFEFEIYSTSWTTITPYLNSGEQVWLEWSSLNGGTEMSNLPPFPSYQNHPYNHPSYVQASVTIDAVLGGTLLNTLRGELNQWEFFKGIMTMFNLVTLQDPTNPTNLLIEPYDDIFLNHADSKTHDWTDRVDTEQLQLKPLELKRKVIFQFTEDEDYPYKVYKAATQQHKYGSMTYTQPNYTLLTDEEVIEATPFAATVMKPVFEDYPDFIAPAIYGSNDDGTEFEAIENMPRILYDASDGSPYNMGGTTFFFPAQNGVSASNQTAYTLFSHTSDFPSSFNDDDYIFGAQQSIGLGDSPVNTLFARFYSNYYGELYHPDTRTLTLKMLLTPAELQAFRFYDKIMIKSSLFRVNKINYKPGELATVELILIP